MAEQSNIWQEFEQTDSSGRSSIWDEFETGAPEEPTQEYPGFGEHMKASFESLVTPVKEAAEGVKEFQQEVAGGFVRASAGLEELIAAGVETVYDAGRIVGREGYKLATNTPESLMEPFVKTNYLSESIQQAEQELLEKTLPENRTLTGKVVGKIAEYAPMTQAVTRSILSYGDDVARGAVKQSPNKIKRNFQEMAQAASKNPEAAIKMEQGISATTATVGQLLEEAGFSPTTQIVGELATGIISGQIANKSNDIVNAYKTLISKEGMSKISEKAAVKYLKNVAKEDPEFFVKLERGLKLQEETGVQMDLAQLTNNPELKAALEVLDIGDDGGGMTKLDRIIKEQTKKIKDYAKPDIDAQDVGLDIMRRDRDKELMVLEQKAKQTVETLSRNVDNAAPLDRIQVGETGREMINAAREAVDAKVKNLYAQVGNPTIGTDKMQKALKEAKKSALVSDDYMRELDSELKEVLEANILGKKPKQDIVTIGQNRPAKIRGTQGKAPDTMTLEQARLLESRLKERIRIANANGERNKSRKLNEILDGIYQQYRSATGETAENIAKLRAAADESRRFHQIFNQGENLLASRIDIQGMERITPEGFARNYIHPNGDTKSSRVETAVENFFDAYGNMKESRNWMANAFGALLKENFPNIQAADPNAVMRFINKHSRFLKSAGIEKRFSNIKNSVAEAKAANEALVMDQKMFKQSVVGKFLESDNPQKYVENSIESGNISQIMNRANKLPKEERLFVKKAIREMAWEGVFNKLRTSKSVDGEILLDTNTVRKALDSPKYSKRLKTVLGKDHVKHLENVLDTVDRIKRNPSQTAGLPLDKADKDLVEKLFTGIRAAAHGFVRPDLIAAQMAKRGFKAYTIKQSQKILKELLENPEMAYKVMKAGETEVGSTVVHDLFAPLIAPIITDEEGE